MALDEATLARTETNMQAINQAAESTDPNASFPTADPSRSLKSWAGIEQVAAGQVAEATAQAGIATTAANTAVNGVVINGIYATAALGVDTAVKNTATIVSGGVGGTNGSGFALALPAPATGGTQAVGNFTVAGGLVTAVNITTPGDNYFREGCVLQLDASAFSAAAFPALTPPVVTLKLGGGVLFGRGFAIAAGTANAMLWKNVAGVATAILDAGGTQAYLPGNATIAANASIAALGASFTDTLQGAGRIQQTMNGAAGTVSYANVSGGGVDITNASTTYYRALSASFTRVAGTLQRFSATFMVTTLSSSNGRVFLAFGAAGENLAASRIYVYRGDGTAFYVDGTAGSFTQVLAASTLRDWVANELVAIEIMIAPDNSGVMTVTAPDGSTYTASVGAVPAGIVWVGTNTNGTTRIYSAIGSGASAVVSKAISDNTVAAAAAQTSATNANTALGLAFLSPNFVNNDWGKTALIGTGAATRAAETHNGYDAVRVDRTAGAEWLISFPRSMFSGNTFSLSGVLVDATNTGRLLRVKQMQTGAEIAGTRVELQPATNAGLPITVTSANNAIHASCDRLDLYISGGANSTGTSAWWANVFFGPGASAAYRPYTGLVNPNGGWAFISPTGNDGNIGTRSLPLATPNAAARALGGSGVIVMLNGEYPLSQFDPTLFKNIKVFGLWSAGAYPIVRCASALTGITKTAGATKIYQASVAGITLANLNWIWQEGVADARTLITLPYRRVQHGGRTNRLAQTKIVKTTDVSSLANAKIELDAAADPRCYYDAGTSTMYFTIAGGGDGTLALIYVPSVNGLIADGNIGTGGSLSIEGLELRYGNANMRPFASSYLNEVAVIGAYENCVDYAQNFKFGHLEVAGAGSLSGTVGDGLNGHSIPVVEGDSLYAHDCRDEGFSPHEYGWANVKSGLAEFNSTGVTIAAGAAGLLGNLITQGNSSAGIRAALAPTDGGVDTRARVTNWTSYGDANGIEGDPANSCYVEVVNGKVFNCPGVAYKNATITDCGHDGVGTAKGSGVTVQNTALVT